ncbi:cell division protein SepF [Actinophytocola algeriensis]|uniref:Cell division protein SepF n=1 Tax=Actinophytocola algeriensis TaxID=1768010 RepID=A0A7W7QB46_9PSEU|nr:cell division protein SepF [Actinophytocola algeriensis]MBB4910329.1 cell division inhibitor SepF [Actinophytocola algeriensis]MBE1480682.1 cell division inhibitor SepF [Actinophytocola algeriensis]
MGTLQKLKAYFGMVPADEYDGYDLDDLDEYGDDYGDRAGHGRGYRRPEYLSDEDDYDPYGEPPRRRGFGRRGDDARYEDGYETELSARADFPARSAARPRAAWAAEAPTQGALAVEPRPAPRPLPRPEPAAKPSTGGYPMGRIVTVHPTGFADARTIGEHYRDGTPVIINLTELDDADARRLVDFAAGLVFAMRGSMDKVTNKVFLISPPNQDPTAEDKRRIAEGGLLNRQ